jgi:thermitase
MERATFTRVGRRHAAASLIAAMLLASIASPAIAAPGSRTATTGTIAGPLAPDRVADEVIVRFKEGVAQVARIDALNDHGARFERALPVRGMQLVRVGTAGSVAQTVAAFEKDPRVAWAEPNYTRRPLLIPNDPRMADLWALENTGQAVNGVLGATPDADIDAPAAWDITTGDPSVIVAVLDSGALMAHPDIASSLWTNPAEVAGDALDNDVNGIVDDVHGADWTGGAGADGQPVDGDPTDIFAGIGSSSHGTHVAGTIAGRAGNGIGITGVAPGIRIMPLRFLTPLEGSVADQISAIGYARANGARIVNGSYGGGPFSQAEVDAYTAASDMIFVFAAGNDGTDNDTDPAYPCSYDLPNLICVAATGQNDELASFSNVGQTSVDLGAPGVNVLSAVAKQQAPVFSTGFEAGLAPNWVTSGTNNTWATTTAAAASGVASLTDSPGGNYAPNTAAFADSVAQNLVGRTRCGLTYDLRVDTVDPDVFRVWTSTNGTAWLLESEWAGSSEGAFFTDAVDLTHRDGVPQLRIGFGIISDAAAQSDGAYVDNVRLGCLPPDSAYSGASDEYAFLGGTSMAAPHVSGVVALVLSARPGLTPVQVKDRVLASVDPLPSLEGTTVTGGRVNARWALEPFPGAVTGSATDVGAGTAIVNAMVNPRLQASTVHFEYGTDATYGLGTSPPQVLPASGTPQKVSAALSGLQPLTTYHVRVVAQNATGSTAGSDMVFTTAEPPPPAQPQPAAQSAFLAQVAPPAAPKVFKKKASPCAKLKGKKRSLCIRRQVALKKCAKLKAGPKKRKCVAKAKRIR